MTGKPCKDCGSTTRKTPYPGPRCTTCHRARKKTLKEAAHEKRVQAVYGLSEGQYAALYAAQDGTCAICRRARGTGRRKLAVDHDHVTGRVRGLLCSPCNRGILGHSRDSIEMLQRAIDYLKSPPYDKL